MVTAGRHSLGPPERARESGVFSLADLEDKDLDQLVRRSCEFFADRTVHDDPLRGKIAGILFTRTSTRTRTAFTTAALRLGGQVISYGPDDLQLKTGESLEDTGRVLGRMLDVLVARTSGPVAQLKTLSQYGCIPVVNAMGQEEHPTQGICDLATMTLHFGTLDNIKVLYVGEGNNSAVALAHGLAHYAGIELTLLTPPGYGVPEAELAGARARAAEHSSSIRQIHSLDEAPDAVDVVYTTRWQTTGTSKPNVNWREEFRYLYIDTTFMSRWPDAVLMHDLPAHRGDEISSEVLEGDRSLAWTQAEMKLTSAMAVLEALAQPRRGSQ
ncbi:ornithine carbamoyltransferase [Streptomyces lasiicapitis]|uniref:Ornithine carbamoyltransferase n=1 Tax=Streptomyces lasiicapitis TaxID=1923961 RepID=A0ABQ2MLY6_9ACTN|nr:ornithine carbamoyltransferase [Streptomyces lasiicapitis]GGO54735.1 ornithine carbamoyltransferase [Streptomyces lasiicapitis]